MTQPMVPGSFVVPERVDSERFILRKLTVEDAVKDYDAVMSSRQSLRHIFCAADSWPADDMTLQDNIEDLRRHQDEFERRVAFAYTVFAPDNSRCLGCVYVYPWAGPVYDARIFYWVRDSEREAGLDDDLGQFLRNWLARSWPIERPVFPGRDMDWNAWDTFEQEAKERRAGNQGEET